MAYDAALAERIRGAIRGRKGVTEREMFGGVAFMLGGNMFIGVVKDDLMVRVGPEAHEAARALPHSRPMDFAGRPMKGYVYVAAAGCSTEREVATWVERGA